MCPVGTVAPELENGIRLGPQTQSIQEILAKNNPSENFQPSTRLKLTLTCEYTKPSIAIVGRQDVDGKPFSLVMVNVHILSKNSKYNSESI